AVHGDFEDLFFGLFEYLLSLRKGGRVVYVDNSFRSALYRLKCFADNVLARLSQYLDRYIVRNQVLLDQGSEKFVFCLRSCRKAGLNFLKTDFDQQFEKFDLLLQAHGDYQSL